MKLATKLRIANTNDPQWDAFVVGHENGWLTYTSAWKEVLEKSFKHIKGYCFYITGDNDADILSGIPVYVINSYLTGRRLVSIPFATNCDPLTSSDHHCQQLIDAIVTFKEKQKCRSLEIRSTSENPFLKRANFAEKSFYVQHFLSLEQPLEKIFQSFHRTCTRQRINRAIKSQLRVKRGETERDLKTFYLLYTQVRKRLSLPPMPYSFMRNIWNILKPKECVDLLLAEKDHTTIAGVMVLKFKKRCSIEFAASNDEYWKMSPNHFLFWEVIRMAHEQGYRIVDFGRASPRNTSLMAFKRRWGTQAVVMPQYYYPAGAVNGIFGSDDTLGKRAIQQVCQRVPATLLPIIGKFCYRHLG